MLTSMTEREAMSIQFEATTPFAVKVYAGSINAISGQPIWENHVTKLHQRALLAQNQSVQDYIVVPGQRWLDGFAHGNGVVKQFFAPNSGDGYTPEAQVTGQLMYLSLQIEVTPTAVCTKDLNDPVSIIVKTLTGKSSRFQIGSQTTVEELKSMIREKHDIPADEKRLICTGMQMEDRESGCDCCS